VQEEPIRVQEELVFTKS